MDIREATTVIHKVLSGELVSPLEGQDPAGRVDVLASRIVEKMVNASNNPEIKRWFSLGKPLLDQELAKRLGPLSVKKFERRRPRGGKVA